MNERRVEKGPIQLDIGIVLSSFGGNSSHDRNQFHGLVSLFGIDFGLYVGPSYNLFETIGPSVGIGLLIGDNGFLAAKLGIHLRRTFGLAVLIPIVPIYDATGASFLAALPVSERTKVATAIPFILVPAALAYQEEIKGLRRHGRETFVKLKSYISGKL